MVFYLTWSTGLCHGGVLSNTDFTRCSSLMSTNMVAFLLLTKHREVRNCSDPSLFCLLGVGVCEAGL